MSIQSNNTLTLRPSMRVLCGFDETSEKPTSVTGVGSLSAYESNAKVTSRDDLVRVMDLSGEGFLNDGLSMPITDSPITGKYGIISQVEADESGHFSPQFGCTITADFDWEYLSMTLSDADGNKTTRMISSPVWSNHQTTIYVDEWTPHRRCYIVSVSLGKAWEWDNSNLVACRLTLRGVSTDLDADLQISEIEIQAYEPTDYSNVIGRAQKGAPIWYQAGYEDDMSDIRYFYLSDKIEWQNNILTVKGEDATRFIDGDYQGRYIASTYADVRENYFDEMKRILTNSGIDYDVVGTPISGTGATASDLFFENGNNREKISNAVNVYRDANTFIINYVDAGRPTLYAQAINRQWDIYADQIAEFKKLIELNTNEIRSSLFSATVGTTEQIATQEAKTGEVYIINVQDPIVPASVAVSPNTPISVISPYSIKLTASANTTYTLTGQKIIFSTTAANDPYIATNTEGGTEFDLDDQQLLAYDGGSLTKEAITAMLDRSNVTYEFVYRGNPHIQPRDILNVEVANWTTDYITVDGLYPDVDLYPSEDLYPYAVYEKKRQMHTEVIPMTCETVTLEHQNGGLTSQITARKGVI